MSNNVLDKDLIRMHEQPVEAFEEEVLQESWIRLICNSTLFLGEDLDSEKFFF